MKLQPDPAVVAQIRKQLAEGPEEWREMGQTLLHSSRLILDNAFAATEQRDGIIAENKGPKSPALLEQMQELWIASNGLRVGLMLLSMAYECLLEGLVLRKGLPIAGMGHALRPLAERAGLPLSDVHLKHLDSLTKMNQLGRYRVHRDSSFGVAWMQWYPQLHTEIEAAIEAGWQAAEPPLPDAGTNG